MHRLHLPIRLSFHGTVPPNDLHVSICVWFSSWRHHLFGRIGSDLKHDRVCFMGAPYGPHCARSSHLWSGIRQESLYHLPKIHERNSHTSGSDGARDVKLAHHEGLFLKRGISVSPLFGNDRASLLERATDTALKSWELSIVQRLDTRLDHSPSSTTLRPRPSPRRP